MFFYQPKIGARVQSVIKGMIALANKNKESVAADINSIIVIVNHGENLRTVMDEYKKECKRRLKLYSDSFEGKHISATKKHKQRTDVINPPDPSHKIRLF